MYRLLALARRAHKAPVWWQFHNPKAKEFLGELLEREDEVFAEPELSKG